MIKTYSKIAITILITVIASTSVYPQKPSELDYTPDMWDARLIKLLTLSGDLDSFTEASTRNEDTKASLNIDSIYSTLFDAVRTSRDLIEVYNVISCEPDREKARILVSQMIEAQVKFIELRMSFLDEKLPGTNSPALATYVTRLKHEVREVVLQLKSIDLGNTSSRKIRPPIDFSDAAKTSTKPKRTEESKGKSNSDPFVATYVGGNRAPEVTITNDSNRTLDLEVGTSKYQIKAKSNERIILDGGAYYFKASAPSVTPLEGLKDFQPGYVYTWTFYIVTTRSRTRTILPIPSRKKRRP